MPETIDTEMLDLWTVKSLYEFQYFNCPGCIFKCTQKQEFVNHLYENHPESIMTLNDISDESLRHKSSLTLVFISIRL